MEFDRATFERALKMELDIFQEIDVRLGLLLDAA
jgi:hypothetical protein